MASKNPAPSSQKLRGSRVRLVWRRDQFSAGDGQAGGVDLGGREFVLGGRRGRRESEGGNLQEVVAD